MPNLPPLFGQIKLQVVLSLQPPTPRRSPATSWVYCVFFCVFHPALHLSGSQPSHHAGKQCKFRVLVGGIDRRIEVGVIVNEVRLTMGGPYVAPQIVVPHPLSLSPSAEVLLFGEA